MKLNYTLSSTAWPESVWRHERGHVDELRLSVEEADGFYGDFGIVWVDLGGGQVCPRVRAFDDSWRALALIAPVLEQFNDEQPTPDEVIAALEEHGWVPSSYHGSLTTAERSREAASTAPEGGPE